MNKLRKFPIVFLIGFIVPFGTGLVAYINQFDGLYGQDSFAYFHYAVDSLAHQFYPPPPFFWPPGYPISILVSGVVFGTVPLAGQIVSLISGGVVVIATAMLTHEVWYERGRTIIPAITAGLVTAIVGQLWQSSAVLMADTLSLASATVGVWALARYARLTHISETPVGLYWLMLAAGAVAYASITRWIYGAVGVVCFIYTLYLFYEYGRTSRRSVTIHTLCAAITASIILLPVLLSAFLRSETTFGGNFQLQFTGWNPVNALRRNFLGEDGYLNYTFPNGLYYAILPTRAFYFTPLLAIFIIPGIAHLLNRAKRFFPVLAWIIITYVFLVGLPQQNVRFTLTYVPPLAVLIAVGIDALWQPRYRNIVIVIVGAGLIWGTVSAVNWTQDFIDRHQTSLETVRWAEAQIPEDAQAIVFGLTLTMQHYTPIDTYEIYNLTPDELTTLLEDNRPTYVLLNVYNIETQWLGKSPQINYSILKDDYGLRQIDRRGAFTLFEVETS